LNESLTKKLLAALTGCRCRLEALGDAREDEGEADGIQEDEGVRFRDEVQSPNYCHKTEAGPPGGSIAWGTLGDGEVSEGYPRSWRAPRRSYPKCSVHGADVRHGQSADPRDDSSASRRLPISTMMMVRVSAPESVCQRTEDVAFGPVPSAADDALGFNRQPEGLLRA